MNPDFCATRAFEGIEWQFAEGDLSLVAFLPVEGNTWEALRLDETGAIENLTPKGRAIARAMLDHALRLLDQTEAPTTAVAR